MNIFAEDNPSDVGSSLEDDEEDSKEGTRTTGGNSNNLFGVKTQGS